MTQDTFSGASPQKPDAQEKRVSGSDINSPQGQSPLPERPPKSLLDWLVRVNLRLIARGIEDHKDTG